MTLRGRNHSAVMQQRTFMMAILQTSHCLAKLGFQSLSCNQKRVLERLMIWWSPIWYLKRWKGSYSQFLWVKPSWTLARGRQRKTSAEQLRGNVDKNFTQILRSVDNRLSMAVVRLKQWTRRRRNISEGERGSLGSQQIELTDYKHGDSSIYH